MVILGKAINSLFGWPIILAMVVALFATTGKLIQNRDEAHIAEGVKKCESDWQLANEIARRQHYEALAAATEKQAEATDILNTELKRDVARITEELEVYRVAAAQAVPVPGGPDPRVCLTDGVRSLARGAEGEGGSVDSAQGGKPASGRQRTKAAQPTR